MENDTIYVWLILGIGLSVVSKLLQYQGKKKAGGMIVIPAALCLLIALMFSINNFARLYSRVPGQAITLLGIAGFLIVVFQLIVNSFFRNSSIRQVRWIIPVLIIGLIAFFQLWQWWV